MCHRKLAQEALDTFFPPLSPVFFVVVAVAVAGSGSVAACGEIAILLARFQIFSCTW